MLGHGDGVDAVAREQCGSGEARRPGSDDQYRMVVDAVVPDGNAPHPAKAMDIIMLALHEGKERTEAEFARLFATAGLRHTTTRHTALPISVVVAEADARRRQDSSTTPGVRTNAVASATARGNTASTNKIGR